jgi:hypothetical protein
LSEYRSFFHVIGIQFEFVPAAVEGGDMNALIAALIVHVPAQSCKLCYTSSKAAKTFSVKKVRMSSILFLHFFCSCFNYQCVIFLERRLSFFIIIYLF